MLRAVAGMMLLGISAAASGAESDRHSITGAVDLSWIQADSELPSWLENGNGKLRFDDDHDGLRFSREFLEFRERVSSTVNGKLTLNINDDKSNTLDLTEAYVEWRPLPGSNWRLRSRAGAFYPHISMENTDAGWSSPYALSSSVINTWIGEELRIIGAEVRLTRDFERWPDQHVSIEGGMFYGNDTTGGLLTWRGWASHDRQTGLFSTVPMPEVPAIDPWSDDGGYPPSNFDPFQEIDHHPGFYAGAEWQWGERARIKVFHYDNHADPEAETSDGTYAWQTWFDHIGAEFTLPGDIGLIGQWIKGSTREGPVLYNLWHIEDVDFNSSFLLLTRVFGRHRFSARYEWFDLKPFNDPGREKNQDDGNVLALSYLFQMTDHLRIGAEYLQIATEHCELGAPCAWVEEAGLPRTTREDSLQVTLRYRFDAKL